MATLELDDMELASAAMGMRGMVRQAQADASRQENPGMRKLFEDSARSHQALLEKLEAARKVGQPKPRGYRGSR